MKLKRPVLLIGSIAFAVFLQCCVHGAWDTVDTSFGVVVLLSLGVFVAGHVKRKGKRKEENGHKPRRLWYNETIARLVAGKAHPALPRAVRGAGSRRANGAEGFFCANPLAVQWV